jgi:hypothetical protein
LGALATQATSDFGTCDPAIRDADTGRRIINKTPEVHRWFTWITSDLV